jgi:copper resistance protein C
VIRARRLATVAALLALLTAGSAALATPAYAHSQLLGTDPADGATVTSPISEIDLTYNERVQGTFTTVVVNGPGGVSYSEGHVQVTDDVVHQRVYPLRSGAYTVAWRAISADGHPVEGQFHFTVALPPGHEPTGGPPRSDGTTSSSGSHTGVWIGVGAGVLIAAGLIVTLLMRPRRGHDPDQSERTDSNDMADA